MAMELTKDDEIRMLRQELFVDLYEKNKSIIERDEARRWARKLLARAEKAEASCAKWQADFDHQWDLAEEFLHRAEKAEKELKMHILLNLQLQDELAKERAYHKETHDAMISTCSDLRGTEAELIEMTKERDVYKDELDALQRKLEKIELERNWWNQRLRPEPCAWKRSVPIFGQSDWETGCGKHSMTAMDYLFCPYCGKKIEVQK